MTGERLSLSAGDLRVELLPDVGGSILRFDRLDGTSRQPLLRGTDASIEDVLDAACFPLVPFANRIRGGRFTCDGRAIDLAPNMAGDASPLHGQGWRAAWRVTEADGAHACLLYRHASDEWPWDYETSQRIELDSGGLTLTLSCTNLSAEPMPCGLGYHPYYPCDADTVLDTTVAAAWTVNAAVLPVDCVPATGCYDLRQRRICGQSLDNGFDGWGGTAFIRWPAQPAALRLSSPDAARFQLYSPAEGGLFVAEPVQNANAALNAPQEQWPGLGIALLGRGERAVLHARFDVVLG